jgi:hypothetical protein
MQSQLSASKDRSYWQSLAGELPESPSTKNPSLDVEAAGVWPHDASYSP